MVRRTVRAIQTEVVNEDGGHKRKQRSSARVSDTGTKSRYFEQKVEDDSEDGEDAEDESDDEHVAESNDAESGEDEEEEVTSEEEKPPRKRRSTAPVKANKSVSVQGTKGNELWRQDVKTPLGVQVIVKKPKARTEGDTPYADETIHPNTMLFLGDLKANNDREWMKMHDPDYRNSLKDWNSFVESLSEELMKVDDTIPELPIKDVVFRIYRDIRFSKDPTPYKPYFSAAWSRTGRKGPYAAYYVQITPNDSFVGGGLWHPEAQALTRLRESIDKRPHQLKDVLMGDRLRKEFLDNVPKRADKVVKAFISSPSNADNALRTKPKGYNADHPEINLLRLKNFTVGTKLADAEVLDTQILSRVAELFAAMQPFIACLNRIVMPDPDDVDDDEEAEEDSEDEEESD